MHKNFTLLSFLNDVLFDLIHFRQNTSLNRDVFIKQILFTGFEALPIVSILSLLLGTFTISEGYYYLSSIGQTDLIYEVLVSVIVRDIGPILVAFIVLARSGTAISTELGNMVIHREIAALKSMGISPISYLISPRILGMVFSLVLLMVYFLFIGIFGGYLVSSLMTELPFAEFVQRFINALTFDDILIMIIKASLAGFVISIISSYHGLSVFRATTEVPQRNIKAVAQSFLAVITINTLITLIYLLLGT